MLCGLRYDDSHLHVMFSFLTTHGRFPQCLLFSANPGCLDKIKPWSPAACRSNTDYAYNISIVIRLWPRNVVIKYWSPYSLKADTHYPYMYGQYIRPVRLEVSKNAPVRTARMYGSYVPVHFSTPALSQARPWIWIPRRKIFCAISCWIVYGA